VKNSAQNSFRHYETTLILDLVNDTLSHIKDRVSFEEYYMLNPRTIKNSDIEKAMSAGLPCGVVHHGDIVLLRDGRVSLVEAFWGKADEVCAQIRTLQDLGGPLRQEADRTAVPHFVEIGRIVRPLSWRLRRPGVYRCVLPLL